MNDEKIKYDQELDIFYKPIIKPFKPLTGDLDD
jgi:hypothetical protein